jgi:hypothetical protein
MLSMGLVAPLISPLINKGYAFVLRSAVLEFICVGDKGVGASLHQDVQGFVSAKVTDEDDKMILECLEHVIFCESVIFKPLLFLSWFMMFACLRRRLLCRGTRQPRGR